VLSRNPSKGSKSIYKYFTQICKHEWKQESNYFLVAVWKSRLQSNHMTENWFNMKLSKPGTPCIKTTTALGPECYIWAGGTMLLHTATPGSWNSSSQLPSPERLWRYVQQNSQPANTGTAFWINFICHGNYNAKVKPNTICRISSCV